MRPDLQDLLPHRRRRRVRRAAGDRRGPAASGAGAVGRAGGVVLDDADVVEGDAELVGDHLGDRGLQALPVVPGAGVDVDLAARLDPDRGGLGRQDAEPELRLDVARQPDTDQPALVPQLLLLLAEGVVADQLGGLLQRLGRADRLELQLHGRGERHLVPRHDVPPADLQRVDAQLLRDDVHHLLAAGGLHHPGAAVGGAPAGVGEGGLRVVGHRPRTAPSVRAGEEGQGACAGRSVTRVRVGPDVLQVPRPPAEQDTVVVHRDRDPHGLLSRVPAADEVLGPVLDPLHRPVADRPGGDRRRRAPPAG